MKNLQWIEKIRFKHLPHISNINKVAWNYYEKQIKRSLVVIKSINMLFTIQYIQKTWFTVCLILQSNHRFTRVEKKDLKHLPRASSVNKVAWNYYEEQIKRSLVVIKSINMLFTIQYIQKTWFTMCLILQSNHRFMRVEKMDLKHFPRASNVNKVVWNYYEKQIKRSLVVIKSMNVLFII